MANTYCQNQRNLDDYYADLDAGRLPVMRGIVLSEDDILRREIIQDLMCRFAVDFDDYRDRLPAGAAKQDSAELAHIQKMAESGIISSELLRRCEETQGGSPIANYFAEEIKDMWRLAESGLVAITDDGIRVTPKGRFLIRNIAMVFDDYLRHKETRAQYSQTV